MDNDESTTPLSEQKMKPIDPVKDSLWRQVMPHDVAGMLDAKEADESEKDNLDVG